MKYRCAILINSCDAFSDVWELFFKSLKVQWPDCEYPIYLNTETKKLPNDIGVDVQIINYPPRKGKDVWGKRYKNALKQIDSEYIIPVLDDFVLSKPFKGQQLIMDAIKNMDDNPDIGCFYLYKHPYVNQEKTEFSGFGIIPQKSKYKLSTRFAIWRKTYLDKCIKGVESPWEWELYATLRAWRFKERMYALLESEDEVYEHPWGGVIWRGLWHTDALKLAEDYNIYIDFYERGFMDVNDPYRQGEVYSVVQNFPKAFFKGFFWKEVGKRLYMYWRKLVCVI